MSLTINTKTFTADSYQKDRVVYIGPAHTLSFKDDVQLSRTPPKPSSIYSGKARTVAKLDRTLTLVGALTPTDGAVVSIEVAVPVGAASADIDALLNDMGSFLSSATFKTHVKGQVISF